MTRKKKPKMTPVYSYLTISGWHGCTTQKVITVGMTPRMVRIRAIARTKLAGRGRWLEPGQEALVPLSAVQHGTFSKPVDPADLVEVRCGT